MNARWLWAFFNSSAPGLQYGLNSYRFGGSQGGEVRPSPAANLTLRQNANHRRRPGSPLHYGYRGDLNTAIRCGSCNLSINGPTEGLFNRGNRTSPVMPQDEPAGYGS